MKGIARRHLLLLGVLVSLSLGSCAANVDGGQPDVSPSANITPYPGSTSTDSITSLFEKAGLQFDDGKVQNVHYYLDRSIESYAAISMRTECSDAFDAIKDNGLERHGVVKKPAPMGPIIDASLEFGWGLEQLPEYQEAVSSDGQKSLAVTMAGNGKCDVFYVLSTF